MLERKEREHGEEERNATNGYASEEVQRLRAAERWMNVELSERDKDTTSKKEGRGSKNPDRTGSMKVYDGGKSGVPGGGNARKRKVMGILGCGNEERENRYWTEREERRCRMC
jgi:hypothetical protein